MITIITGFAGFAQTMLEGNKIPPLDFEAYGYPKTVQIENLNNNSIEFDGSFKCNIHGWASVTQKKYNMTLEEKLNIDPDFFESFSKEDKVRYCFNQSPFFQENLIAPKCDSMSSAEYLYW